MTLLGQGLTLPAVVRHLGVLTPAEVRSQAVLRAHRELVRAGLDRLRRLADADQGEEPAPGEAGSGESGGADADVRADARDQLVGTLQRSLDRLATRITDPRGAASAAEADSGADDTADGDARDRAVRAAYRRLLAEVDDAERSRLAELERSGAVRGEIAAELARSLDARAVGLSGFRPGAGTATAG